MTSIDKRLGEDRFFFGAFVVFLHNFVHFSCVLFGGKEIFCIFANGKECCNNMFPRVHKVNILNIITQRIET